MKQTVGIIEAGFLLIGKGNYTLGGKKEKDSLIFFIQIYTHMYR